MVGEGEWLALGTALRRPWTRKAPLDEEGALGRGRRPWTRQAPLDEEGTCAHGGGSWPREFGHASCCAARWCFAAVGCGTRRTRRLLRAALLFTDITSRRAQVVAQGPPLWLCRAPGAERRRQRKSDEVGVHHPGQGGHGLGWYGRRGGGWRASGHEGDEGALRVGCFIARGAACSAGGRAPRHWAARQETVATCILLLCARRSVRVLGGTLRAPFGCTEALSEQGRARCSPAAQLLTSAVPLWRVRPSAPRGGGAAALMGSAAGGYYPLALTFNEEYPAKPPYVKVCTALRGPASTRWQGLVPCFRAAAPPRRG